MSTPKGRTREHAARDAARTPAQAAREPARADEEARTGAAHEALAAAAVGRALRPAQVLALQRSIGNRAVGSLLAAQRQAANQSRIQRYTLAQVGGGSAQAAGAREYRQNAGQWAWRPNVATLHFHTDEGAVHDDAAVSAGAGLHAEHLLVNRQLPGPVLVANLLAAEFRGNAVLYTERIPCGNCAQTLQQRLPRAADMVYYTNPRDNADGSNPQQQQMVEGWQWEHEHAEDLAAAAEMDVEMNA